MSCSYFPLLVEGGQRKGGGRKCSLSQSLVFPSQTGLLLQAADMRALLKRRHPQLHLTTYSTDTAQRGKGTPVPSYLHHLRQWHFLAEAVWKLQLLYSNDTEHCSLLALCSVALEDFLLAWIWTLSLYWWLAAVVIFCLQLRRWIPSWSNQVVYFTLFIHRLKVTSFLFLLKKDHPSSLERKTASRSVESSLIYFST